MDTLQSWWTPVRFVISSKHRTRNHGALDSTRNFNWSEKEKPESFFGILVLTQLLLMIINSRSIPDIPGYLGYLRNLHHDMESW